MTDHIAREYAPPPPVEGPGAVKYAILDQALWQKFRNATEPDEFMETWLAILCRQISGVASGMVMLGEPDTGPYTPIAFWPERAADEGLTAIAERALSQRQGISTGTTGSRMVQLIASPLIVNERLYGACALSLSVEPAAINAVMRKVQWASGWVEVLLRRQLQVENEEVSERNRLAFDMLAAVIEAKGFAEAATALVTELAMRLACDPVSVGFVRGRRCRVATVSHAAGFGNKVNIIRDIGAAMDEAVDQRAIVLYPPQEHWEYRVLRAHEELVETHKCGGVLTIPLQSGHQIVGALTLQRPRGSAFDETTVDLCDAVAAVVGPVLEEKRRNDRNVLVKLWEAAGNQLRRLLGPGYFGRKLATLIAVILAAYFSVATTEYSVTSSAVVRGTIQRTVVAPFNGYVSSQSARAGEVVKQGQILAQLDDQDLTLERLRLTTTRQQKTTEYDRALMQHERAEALIVKAQIDQADAQLALIDEQLKRTRLLAPFDGYVVNGDLSQSIGAAVERGQELFTVAPLKSYRVILEVDESDIDDIEIGRQGVLRVSALPQEPLTYRIEQITAISTQKEGHNFFKVEAALDHLSDRLRPGMEGIAKTSVDERLLIRVYTDKMVQWAYLAAWRWMP